MKQLFTIPARVHGAGKVLFAWQRDGNYIATAGSNGLVHVYDRSGDLVDEVPLGQPGACLALEWDKDGELLAVLQAGNTKITLWDSTKRATFTIDTMMKDPSLVKWSKMGPQLAIGTTKGNLVLYNKDSRKLTPIQGKHSKKITCGDWSSSSNVLALGGQDNVMTVSDENGNTTDNAELKYEPMSLQFAAAKSDGRLRAGAVKPQTTVSINMGGNTLLLYNLKDPENPVELAFQARYGSIVKYQWFGDGYLMIGFSEGYVVVISTHMKEIVEELFSGKFHKDRIDDIALSESLQRAATAGGNVIKLVDVKGWKEIKDETTTLDASYGSVTGLEWTEDGQILTVATSSGAVLNYLARMPTIVDASGLRVAYMSSLRELSVVDTVGDAPAVTLPISVEPSFVALGPRHVAVGMNNQVWYYLADATTKGLVNEKEYLSTVDSVKLTSQYACVLSEGRISIHPIDPSAGGDRGSIILPPRDDIKATCVAATEDFCVYGTSSGSIEFFYFAEWTLLAGVELRHEEPIRSVFPNPKGTRLVFVDASYRGFLFNPVNHLVMPVLKMHETTKNVLWDSADWGVFVTTDNKSMNAYIHAPLTIHGPQITNLGLMDIKDNGDMVMEAASTDVPHNHTPVLVHDGVVTCQTPSGSITTFTLRTHDAVVKADRVTGDKIRASFAQNVALLRLQAAWDVARVLNQRPFWLALSGKAMETLNISMAIKVYRFLGDAGMVMALEQLQDVEDKNLLAGHIALLFGDYSQAQELFLLSTRPITALEMHRDLLHWDQAMKLAATLAPEQTPEIALEYGKQLEFRGEYQQALAMYQESQRALRSQPGAVITPDTQAAITGGIARMSLRTGDLRTGLTLANSSSDKQLQKECGAILESLKQYSDAAAMYSKAEQFDKAAGILILTKNFAAVTPLLDKITLPKLHSQYAKAKEATKEYLDAARAYERARDMDSVVRILLENLNKPDKAMEVVRATKSSEAALMVARHCLKGNDFRGAIEFFLTAKRAEEAFSVAREHDEMELYAEALGNDATNEDNHKIASFYEARGKTGQAGKYYAKCGDYHKSLNLFLQCGDKMLDEAIRVVGLAKNDLMTHTLVDFLMGETDGVPKDPHYIFHLYMALGNYAQAGTTAIIIAKQEQEMGNYKVAHAILLQTHQELESHKLRVPQDVQRMLSLLHSYVIVKKLVKLNDHVAAARMLVRVAKNISKFPSHVVPILTSTVIECQRAGMKKSAFEYAAMMMRPEYRQLIEPKFKTKIETLVRRPSKEEIDEEATPCPFCSAPLTATSLDCPSCKSNVPYCIVTGRHMVLDDWTMCPECKFPALHSAMTTYLTADTTCPMCEKEVDGSKFVKYSDPTPFLKKSEGEEAADKPTA